MHGRGLLLRGLLPGGVRTSVLGGGAQGGLAGNGPI